MTGDAVVLLSSVVTLADRCVGGQHGPIQSGRASACLFVKLTQRRWCHFERATSANSPGCAAGLSIVQVARSTTPSRCGWQGLTLRHTCFDDAATAATPFARPTEGAELKKDEAI